MAPVVVVATVAAANTNIKQVGCLTIRFESWTMFVVVEESINEVEEEDDTAEEPAATAALDTDGDTKVIWKDV